MSRRLYRGGAYTQTGECLDLSIEGGLYTEMGMSRLLYRGGAYTQR